jgi:hypothetical protein
MMHSKRVAHHVTCHIVDSVAHPSGPFTTTFDGHVTWRSFVVSHSPQVYPPTTAMETYQHIFFSMEESSGSPGTWKAILVSHISHSSARTLYIETLSLPSFYWDPRSEQGFDVWFELLFGYNLSETVVMGSALGIMALLALSP